MALSATRTRCECIGVATVRWDCVLGSETGRRTDHKCLCTLSQTRCSSGAFHFPLRSFLSFFILIPSAFTECLPLAATCRHPHHLPFLLFHHCCLAHACLRCHMAHLLLLPSSFRASCTLTHTPHCPFLLPCLCPSPSFLALPPCLLSHRHTAGLRLHTLEHSPTLPLLSFVAHFPCLGLASFTPAQRINAVTIYDLNSDMFDLIQNEIYTTGRQLGCCDHTSVLNSWSCSILQFGSIFCYSPIFRCTVFPCGA